MSPTLANGKICYVEMPANDIGDSATFYEKVFGWPTHPRSPRAFAIPAET